MSDIPCTDTGGEALAGEPVDDGWTETITGDPVQPDTEEVS